MTENSKKRKTLTSAIAVILAVLVAIGGSTFAYLQANTDDVVNEFVTNQVSVDLKESTEGKYNIVPGTSEFKDPTVTVNSTVPAYVYVEITDNTDGLVDYAIESGWKQLSTYDNVYYREIDGSSDKQQFTVLKDNKVSYDADIVNRDMLIQNEDGTYSLKDGITLSFKALAIQKEGFYDEVEAYKYLVSGEKPVLSGYTALYEYDLSATMDDSVKAYYCVPNQNTTPISFSRQMRVASAAQTDNVIEYNGVRYELSDEDTLVISGTGEMKENIQSDLIQYGEIQKVISEKYSAQIITDNMMNHYSELLPNVMYIQYVPNSVYPNEIFMLLDGIICSSSTSGMHNEELSQNYLDIKLYTDEILSEYVVALPKTVIIKEGVTNISNYAFNNCRSLEKVEIPNTVKTIGREAFRSCSSLSEINLPESITSIGANSFSGCAKLADITLPSQISSIEAGTFSGCAITELTIPNGVTSIAANSFSSNTKLISMRLPNTVTSIGISAFDGCSNLKELFIPSSVTKIGTNAFVRVNSNCIYYCETQEVANLISSDKNIVIAPEMF